MASSTLRLGCFAVVLWGCVGDTPVLQPTDGAVDDRTTPPGDGGNDTGPSDAPLDVAPSPVNGTVVDAMKQPIANADVRIGGLDAKTDSSGKFTLVAPATYDVMVSTSTTGTTETLTTTSGKKLTGVFGISTRTPTIQVAGAVARSTTLTLTTTGLGALGSDVLTMVTIPTTNSSSSSFFASASVAVNWAGDAPSSGVLWGYQMTPGSFGLPSAWKAVTTGPINYTFTSGTSSLTVPFTNTVATSALTVNIDPSGDTIFRAYVGHERQAGGRLVYLGFGFNQTTLNTVMPNLGSSTVTIWATTPSGTMAQIWRVGLKLPLTLALKVPVGDLTPTTPAADATGVGVGTSFSWSALPNRAYHVRINCGSSPASYLADFLTMTPSFTLPDATALGIPIPAAKSCTWIVDAFEPATDANGLVGPGGWVTSLDSVRGPNDGSTFGTSARKFTTP